MSAPPASSNLTQDGVVLLHGISRTPRSFRKMQTAIEGAGLATLNQGYASRSKALEALAEDMHPSVLPTASKARFTSSAIPWVACSLAPISQDTGRRTLAEW